MHSGVYFIEVYSTEVSTNNLLFSLDSPRQGLPDRANAGAEPVVALQLRGNLFAGMQDSRVILASEKVADL